MNIWNYVFLVLVFLFSGAVVFFSSQEYSVRNKGQKAIEGFEKAIVYENTRAVQAQKGGLPADWGIPVTFLAMNKSNPDKYSLGELRGWLNTMESERSKVWYNCTIQLVTPKAVMPPPLNPAESAQLDGWRADWNMEGEAMVAAADQLKRKNLPQVRLTVTSSGTAVVKPDDMQGVVYLFSENSANSDNAESGREGGFLGSFTVSSAPQPSANGFDVMLTAVEELDDAEVKKIEQATSNSCSVYATMPQDRLVFADGENFFVFSGNSRESGRFAFDDLTLEQAQKVIPDDAVRNGLMDKSRDLINFDALITQLYAKRLQLNVDLDQAKRETARLDSNHGITKQEEAAWAEEIKLEHTKIAAMRTQSEAVQAILAQYTAVVEQYQNEIAEQQQKNEEQRAAIADAMERAAQAIIQNANAAKTGEVTLR